MKKTRRPSSRLGKLLRAAVAPAAIAAGSLALLLGFTELILKASGFGPASDPRFGLLSAICCRPDEELIWLMKPEDERSPLGRRAPPKRPGVTRIMAVGDSSTYGIGVEASQTYAALLEKALEERAGAGRFEVVNAGTPGYSSWQALNLLKRLWPEYAPDVVVVYLGFNDGVYGSYPDDERELDWRMRARFRLMSLRSYRWLDGKLRPLLLRRLGDRPAGPWVLRVPPGSFRRNLLEIVGFARSRGARPLLLVPPCTSHPDPRINDPAFDRFVRRTCQESLPKYRKAIGEVARNTGTPLIDLTRLLPPDAGLGVFADPVHPGPEGHRRIAEAVARHIEKTELRR